MHDVIDCVDCRFVLHVWNALDEPPPLSFAMITFMVFSGSSNMLLLRLAQMQSLALTFEGVSQLTTGSREARRVQLCELSRTFQRMSTSFHANTCSIRITVRRSQMVSSFRACRLIPYLEFCLNLSVKYVAGVCSISPLALCLALDRPTRE